MSFEKKEEAPISKRKQRALEWLRKARERSGYEHDWFLSRKKKKIPLAFHTIGGTVIERLVRFGPYKFNITMGKKEEQEIEKLDTLCICKGESYSWIKKHFRVYQELKDQGLFPAFSPEDRYQFPEGLLERALEERCLLNLLLIDGTLVQGVPIDMSVYSVLLKVPDAKGAQLLVFKHGVHQAELSSASKRKRISS